MTAARPGVALTVLAALLLSACSDDGGQAAEPDDASTTTAAAGAPAEGALPEDADDRRELVLDRAREICDALPGDEVLSIVAVEDLELGEPTHLLLQSGGRSYDVAMCDFELPDDLISGVGIGEVFPAFGEELGVAEVEAMLAEELEDPFSDVEEVEGLGEVAFVMPVHEGHELWIASEGAIVRVSATFEDEGVTFDQMVALGELAVEAVG